MPSITQNDIWFKEAQSINLNRLQYGPDYLLSGQEKSQLNTIANSLSPVRCYAQALLTFLTGQRFDRQVPTENRSIELPENLLPEVIKPVIFNVVPNPSSGIFSIMYDGKLPDENIALLIFDIYGRELHNQVLSGNKLDKINVSHLANGLYIVSIIQSGGQIQNQKIVIKK